MKHLAIITFFFLLALGSSSAQETFTQTIRGTIVDVDTRMPLFGVNVIVLDSDPFLGAVTDMDGQFRLENVPVGRQNIKITYVGFLERMLTNIEVTSGKELVLEVELEESVSSLDEVVVSASGGKRESMNEMAVVSARQFTVEESGRYAGSRNEVSRMAANYAGVSNANDSRNDIVIRGNSPNGLLWRMEGMDIPGPNHFSGVGSNGGAISMLNYNVISNSDFMTSAFPAEYGNGTSGVFDIRLRNGNNEKREYMFQLGALGTEFMVEGPFSNKYKGSYLVNYRFSTTSLLTQMGIDFGFAGTADYQDISYKFHLPAGKAGTFTLFGLAGNNVYAVNADQREEDNFDENFAENTNDRFENDLGMFGASHTLPLGSKTYIRTVVGFTGKRSLGASDSVSTENQDIIPYFGSDNYEYRYTAHSFTNTKFNARNKLKVGVIGELTQFQLKEQLFQPELGRAATYNDGEGSSVLLQAYSQWQHKLSDQLTFNTGLHYQQLTLNNSLAVEPRAGVRWQFAPTQSINAGYGLHSQVQSLPTYFVATEVDGNIVNTNEDLDFTRSHHLVLGYDRSLTENTRIKLETYYQYLYDIPVNGPGSSTSFSMANEGTNFILANEDSLANNGLGENIGLELTLERFFNRGFYYLLTASLFDSRYQGSDEVWRSTVFNGNYVANLLAGKEFSLSEKSKLLVDVKVNVAGGRRYTPIDLEASREAGAAVEIDDRAFTEKQPDYFRTDFKVTYRLNQKRVSHEFFVNVDNLFNTQNVFAQTYSQRTNQIENIYQLGVFPTFQYKIFF